MTDQLRGSKMFNLHLNVDWKVLVNSDVQQNVVNNYNYSYNNSESLYVSC